MNLFNMNIWKSGPHKIETYKELRHGGAIEKERWETPEEYKARNEDIATVSLLGKQFSFRLPWTDLGKDVIPVELKNYSIL